MPANKYSTSINMKPASFNAYAGEERNPKMMTNVGMAMMEAVTERKSFCMGKMDVVLSVGDNSGCKKFEASGIHNDILIQLCIELRAKTKRPVKFTGRFFICVTAHAEIDGCLEMLKSGVEGMIMK